MKPGSWKLIFSPIDIYWLHKKGTTKLFLNFFPFGWEMKFSPLCSAELSLSLVPGVPTGESPPPLLRLETRLLFVLKLFYSPSLPP